MRIFKRLKSIELRIEELINNIANLAGHIVAAMEATKDLSKIVQELSDENKALKEKMEELEKRIPEYEEAVAKGVVENWEAGLRAIADFNPMVELNKPEAGK